ncbi:MAG: hypothetical protein K2K39_03025 [Clostridia bacterium]|nr:hypothetical protein [Clostridia bacterium]
MNKLPKLLSVFAISVAVGTGIAGVAGCNKGGGGKTVNKEAHECSIEYSQINGNQEKHKVHCKNDGHIGGDTEEAHTWQGDVCKNCGYTKTVISTEVEVKVTVTCKTSFKVGETINLTAKVEGGEGVSQKVTWQIEYGDDVVQLVDGNKLKGLKDGEFGLTVIPEADTTKAVVINGRVLKLTKYDELAVSENKIIDNGIMADAATLPAPVVGTLGIYDYDGTGGAKTENGVASASKGLYVDFGATKEIIEGNIVLNIDKSEPDFTFFSITAPGLSAPQELFGITTNSEYCWNGSGDGKVEFGRFTYEQKSDVEINFKYNKVTNALKVSLGEDARVTVYDGVAEFTDTVSGISVHTKCTSADDLVTIKSVAIVTYDLNATEYAAAKRADLDAIATEVQAVMGAGWTSADTENNLSSALTAANTAFGATDVTRTAVDTALSEYKSGVLAALKAEYKARLAAAYPAANYAKDPAEYDEKISAANGALDKVTEIGGFAAVFEEHCEILDNVLTDEEKKPAVVNITLKLDNDAGETVGSIAEAESGTAISLADLLTALTANTHLKRVTVYEDAAHNNVIAESYTPSAAEGVEIDTATLFVVLEDLDNTGTFIYNVTDEPFAPQYDTIDSDDIKAEDMLDLDNSSLAVYDSSHFRLCGADCLTFKIALKAGQTVAVCMTGYSENDDYESSYLTVTATGCGVDTTATVLEVEPDENSLEYINYVADEDGVVEIIIENKESGGNIVKLSEILIIIEDAV